MKKNSCLGPVTKMLKSNDNWMISWYELTSFKSWCQLYCHIPELSYPQCSPPESLNYSMLHADQLHLMWDWLSASL